MWLLPTQTYPSATTACPTGQGTATTPLTTRQLCTVPTMLLRPFRTTPSMPLASVACLTTVCPTADFHPTTAFHPTPTQACPALPTTPLPLPLQRRKRRSRQLWRSAFHKCATIDCRSLLNTDKRETSLKSRTKMCYRKDLMKV